MAASDERQMPYREHLEIPWIIIPGDAVDEEEEEDLDFPELYVDVHLQEQYVMTEEQVHHLNSQIDGKHCENRYAEGCMPNEPSDDQTQSEDPPLEMNNTCNIVTPDSGVGSLEMKELTLDPSSIGNRLNMGQSPSPQAIKQQLLLLPPSGTVLNASPRPLRRTLSARAVNELGTPQLGTPRMRRSTASIGPEFPSCYYGDSISVINVPVQQEMTKCEKSHIMKRNLSQLLSGIYAVFLLMFGVVIYLSDQRDDQRILTEVFSSVIAGIGMVWLITLHVDLCSYKKEVLRQLKEREDAMQEASERFSNATQYIINTGYNFQTQANNTSETDSSKSVRSPPYRFMQGRHSGSFYLKIGMAAFCFGNLVYEGLQLGQHILNFVDHEKMNCSRPTSIILHTVVPLYAFYQLFITFKYSNIVINRYKAAARFGLMHLIATCLCFWFSTIVEEAVEDYNIKSGNSTANYTNNNMEFDVASFHIVVHRKQTWENPYHCTADSVLSIRSMSAIPYLYPFAIEYNLLLAGVWYIVWQNIGTESLHSDPHHLRHAISQDEEGYEAITYQSNLVISADCHASNKGLFAGLFLLLTTIVTVIVFFVAMTTEGYQARAVSIHTSQEGFLTLVGLIAVIISFAQIHQLDLSRNPITFLDDVLLFVPLPFYFVHSIMSVIAEYGSESYTRLSVHILVTIEVVVQTPFIIDGLRRCSNSQSLRYKKPGRELITFLIVLNLALWIVNTFELKSVEHHHAQEEYFGDLIWMFIGHTTVPLMLFYRFHSSVCLADMWKSAYEKENQ